VLTESAKQDCWPAPDEPDCDRSQSMPAANRLYRAIGL